MWVALSAVICLVPGVSTIFFRSSKPISHKNVVQALVFIKHWASVAQLVEHRVVTREVVSLTPAGPLLRCFK